MSPSWAGLLCALPYGEPPQGESLGSSPDRAGEPSGVARALLLAPELPSGALLPRPLAKLPVASPAPELAAGEADRAGEDEVDAPGRELVTFVSRDPLP
jgi:hypothetical protein